VSADDQAPIGDTREEALDQATTDAWVAMLARRRVHFARDGIGYQTLVVPDPVRRLVGPSPFARLCDALDEETRAQCVYPLDELVAGQDRYETFDPQDGTWTDWGAWIGYRASVAAIAAGIPGPRILDESDLSWSERPAAGDAEEPGAQLAPAVTLRSPRSQVLLSVRTEDGDTYLVLEQDAPELPTAVMFGDSSMDAIAKFFAESFRRIAFVSSPNAVYHDLVERERPEVVIHEVAERRLVIAPSEPSTRDFRAVFGDLLLDDSEARADQRRSRSLARAGRVDEALAASDDVLALVSPTARLLLHRARLHLQAGQTAAALESLRHARTLDPDDGAVGTLLGQVLAAMPGRESEGAAALARAARIEPRQVRYWQQAIAAALRIDDLRLAEELRREALAQHPDDPHLANAASWVLAATGRLEEAEEAAGHAARAQPGTIEHLWQLASIQIRRGRLEDAADTMDRLGLLRPEDPDVRHYREVLHGAMRGAGPGTVRDQNVNSGRQQ
jgi:Flp pilus assembly protein TadD